MKYSDLHIDSSLVVKCTPFYSVGEVKFGSYQAKPYDIPVHHIDKFYVHQQGYAYAIVSHENADELKEKTNKLIRVYAKHYKDKANKCNAYSNAILSLIK